MHATPQLFAKHHLRYTTQRALVYDALAACASHPTADELYEIISHNTDADQRSASRATVYNTLEALSQVGLCQRLTAPNGLTRFDADTSAHCHLALPDGTLKDIPDHLGNKLLQSLPTKTLNQIEQELHVTLDQVAISLHAAPAAEPPRSP